MSQTHSPEPTPIDQGQTSPAPTNGSDHTPPGMEGATANTIPRAYRSGKTLILENQPPLPTDMCIKSGKRAFRELTVQLRNPKNPKTWFGKRPSIACALSRKAFDNHRVAITLTWSILTIGALLFVAGVATLSFLTIFVGLAAVATSGIFRATSPVTAEEQPDGSLEVHGACPAFLDRFEQG